MGIPLGDGPLLAFRVLVRDGAVMIVAPIPPAPRDPEAPAP